RAASREREPVGMAGTSTFSRVPSRMIDPLPNCLSIWARAASIAFARSLSSAMYLVLFLYRRPPLRRMSTATEVDVRGRLCRGGSGRPTGHGGPWHVACLDAQAYDLVTGNVPRKR